MRNIIYGVGVNDASYKTQLLIDGRMHICPFYQKWRDMLKRCYSIKYQQKHPTYKGCSTAKEWLIFSNFKKWMESQDWQGKHLDKDILFVGNKIYSPETCALVDSITNKFIIDCKSSRGEWPLGVYLNNNLGKFQSGCSNPFTKNTEYLGLFDCPNEAHEAWRRRKYELACGLAEYQADQRVASALKSRYK